MLWRFFLFLCSPFGLDNFCFIFLASEISASPSLQEADLALRTMIRSGLLSLLFFLTTAVRKTFARHRQISLGVDVPRLNDTIVQKCPESNEHDLLNITRVINQPLTPYLYVSLPSPC